MNQPEDSKVQEHHVYAGSGKPYGTAEAAERAIKQKRLGHQCHVVMLKEGEYVISTQPKEIPGTQTPRIEQDIDSEIKKTDIPPAKKPVVSSQSPRDYDPDDLYFKVRFNAKAAPFDEDDVTLAVNGETLKIQREKVVIIPARFKECADHGTRLQFKQTPEHDRKIVGKISTFPYQELGQATREEYENQKKVGDKQTKENIKKFGWKHVPDIS